MILLVSRLAISGSPMLGIEAGCVAIVPWESARARGSELVIGILDQHSHFATDALQAHRHRQSLEIIRCTRRRSHLQIKRPGMSIRLAAMVTRSTMSRMRLFISTGGMASHR